MINYCPNCGEHLQKFQSVSFVQALPYATAIKISKKAKQLPQKQESSQAPAKRGRPKKKWEAPKLGDGPKVKTFKDMSPEEKEKMIKLYGECKE